MGRVEKFRKEMAEPVDRPERVLTPIKRPGSVEPGHEGSESDGGQHFFETLDNLGFGNRANDLIHHLAVAEKQQ